MALELNKNALRTNYLLKRRSITAEHYNSLNEQLVLQLRKLDFQQSNFCHLYLPIAQNKEPNTYDIAAYLSRTYPNLKLVLSKSNVLSNEMQHILWDKETKLKNNRWGIPEPEEGEIIPEKDIDIIFVPLLTFDKSGHRVGYGKGYYDRFLGACNRDATKIGLSFFKPVSKISDVGPFDIALDICITPDKVWTFR